jgi:hypothetical protein
MTKERIKATIWGAIFTLATATMILIGSRNLEEFDAALVGYTFAVLFAVFSITYRYVIWLQRPPTAIYWKRGWQLFFRPKYIWQNIKHWFTRVVGDFALNHFIFKRGKSRWAAHWFIMWGCTAAMAITFPLVFGWIHFETVPGDAGSYRVYIFGFPASAFPIHSILGFITFHGLVWASILVIIGVLLALRRRMRDHATASSQEFGEDFLPLILLFAISITGLMLTASYTWMKGYAYDFLAILHAITVIFTLLWMPFGKFFHIFQRPAQLGVSFYKDIGKQEEMAKCSRCHQPYAAQIHIDDLITVEKQLGFRFELKNGKTDHYQRICPRCRRAMLVISQGQLWRKANINAQGNEQPTAAVSIAEDSRTSSANIGAARS